MQIRNSQGTLLYEALGGQARAASLLGGEHFAALEKATKKQQMTVNVSEAFSGYHLLDFVVDPHYSVRDIKSKVEKQLDSSVNLRFVNGAAVVLDDNVNPAHPSMRPGTVRGRFLSVYRERMCAVDVGGCGRMCVMWADVG